MNDDLKQLLGLFQRSTRPLTARRIADELNTYPATALRRITALKTLLRRDNRNPQIKETVYREGRRGPPSAAWVLSK